MTLTISEHAPPLSLAYADVSIAFEVREVFDVLGDRESGFSLASGPRALAVPFIKDYDREPGGHPADWSARFDTSAWGVLRASLSDMPVGGAVIAWNTPGVDLLDGRADLALLWDIRVAPMARGRGVGSALFLAAERWALAHGAHELKVETQTLNVPACTFYRKHGCELRTIHPGAYPALPEEVQLLWYKRLSGPVDH